MTRAVEKWKAIFWIYLQEGLAYRASGIVWILTDLTTAVTMPLVWVNASKGKPIAGYNGADFVLYYLCYLLVQSFVTSHIMWELSAEIKEGKFSIALLRPMNYLTFTFCRSFAWRAFRTALFFPVFLGLLYLYRGQLEHAHVHLGPVFFLSVILGHLVSFCFVTAMAMLALFVSEAQAIFGLYYIPMLFLSGSLFPIAMLPDWVRGIAYLFPFYFTAGLPTDILVGRVPESQALPLILGQAFWVVGALAVGRYLFNKGVRSYSAVGM